MQPTVVALFGLVCEDESEEEPDTSEATVHGDRLGPAAAQALCTLAENTPADQVCEGATTNIGV